MGFYSMQEISEHIFDEGSESIDFAGNISSFFLNTL